MMDAKYLAEIKARCEAGRPTARIDVKALIAEVERLQKIVKLQKASCSLVKTVEAGNTIAENATLKKALILMGNDLADWMGNGTGEFWAKDYTAQAQEQEGKK